MDGHEGLYSSAWGNICRSPMAEAVIKKNGSAKKDWKIKLRLIPLRQVRGSMGIRCSITAPGRSSRGAMAFPQRACHGRWMRRTWMPTTSWEWMRRMCVISTLCRWKIGCDGGSFVRSGRSAARYCRSVVYRGL